MAAKPFTIPWIYLDDSNIPNRDPNQKPILKKSFSQALKNIRDIPHSQLLKTSLKGNEFAIPIPDEEYESGLEDHRNSLHARIMWRKGSTPLTVMALRAKLLSIWKNLVRWGITSLGNGFYKLCFSFVEDANSIRSLGSWNLNLGFLSFLHGQGI